MPQSDFNWLQPISSLVATFLGAGLAYSLAIRRERNNERNEQFAAYNRSLAVLLDMYNSLETYRQDVVAQWQGKSLGWLNAPVSLTRGWGTFRIKHDDLVVLLETKRANLFPQLLLVDSNFDALANLIQQRDDLLIKEAHPKLSSLLRKESTEQHIKGVLGIDTAHQLEARWKGICDRIADQIQDTKTAIQDVGDAAAFTHPGRLTVSAVLFKDGAPP